MRRALTGLLWIGAAAGLGAGVVFLAIPERKTAPLEDEFVPPPSTNGLSESLSLTNLSLRFDAERDLPVNNLLNLGQ